ncbi:MAG: YbgC/FadM family acyl-CoA thioesterase [Sphingomicrobium sp.]
MATRLLDRPYRGGFVESGAGPAEHRFALTVYFEDTDAFRIVYYANYLRFMERARSDMLRAVGIDQGAEMDSNGGAYAVVEVAIRYRRPARLGDDLLVVSTVEQVLASSVHIHQRVMRGAELLTDGRVTAAFLDREGRPQRQPKDWVERFRKISGSLQ